MKAWITAIALVAVLGMSSFADAKGTGKHGKGIHGKITALTDTTMTITVGGKKNPHTMTVQFTATTPVTIDGATGKLDASLIGKRVSIKSDAPSAAPAAAPATGAAATPAAADTVTATSIAVTTKHHAKKPAV